MAYNLVITEHANELLDKLVYYLLFQKNSRQAANHLLEETSEIYTRLKENPYQFPESRDPFLKSKNYREAQFSEMNYKAIFVVQDESVIILGFFHGTERYWKKL